MLLTSWQAVTAAVKKAIPGSDEAGGAQRGAKHSIFPKDFVRSRESRLSQGETHLVENTNFSSEIVGHDRTVYSGPQKSRPLLTYISYGSRGRA